MPDYIDMVNKFATLYVEDLKRATNHNDWEEMAYVRRDAKRLVRDLNKVIASIDFLTNLGIQVG